MGTRFEIRQRFRCRLSDYIPSMPLQKGLTFAAIGNVKRHFQNDEVNQRSPDIFIFSRKQKIFIVKTTSPCVNPSSRERQEVCGEHGVLLFPPCEP
jgi:hypothetical protein